MPEDSGSEQHSRAAGSARSSPADVAASPIKDAELLHPVAEDKPFYPPAAHQGDSSQKGATSSTTAQPHATEPSSRISVTLVRDADGKSRLVCENGPLLSEEDRQLLDTALRIASDQGFGSTSSAQQHQGASASATSGASGAPSTTTSTSGSNKARLVNRRLESSRGDPASSSTTSTAIYSLLQSGRGAEDSGPSNSSASSRTSARTPPTTRTRESSGPGSESKVTTSSKPSYSAVAGANLPRGPSFSSSKVVAAPVSSSSTTSTTTDNTTSTTTASSSCSTSSKRAESTTSSSQVAVMRGGAKIQLQGSSQAVSNSSGGGFHLSDFSTKELVSFSSSSSSSPSKVSEIALPEKMSLRIAAPKSRTPASSSTTPIEDPVTPTTSVVAEQVGDLSKNKNNDDRDSSSRKVVEVDDEDDGWTTVGPQNGNHRKRASGGRGGQMNKNNSDALAAPAPNENERLVPPQAQPTGTTTAGEGAPNKVPLSKRAAKRMKEKSQVVEGGEQAVGSGGKSQVVEGGEQAVGSGGAKPGSGASSGTAKGTAVPAEFEQEPQLTSMSKTISSSSSATSAWETASSGDPGAEDEMMNVGQVLGKNGKDTIKDQNQSSRKNKRGKKKLANKMHSSSAQGEDDGRPALPQDGVTRASGSSPFAAASSSSNILPAGGGASKMPRTKSSAASVDELVTHIMKHAAASTGATGTASSSSSRVIPPPPRPPTIDHKNGPSSTRTGPGPGESQQQYKQTASTSATSSASSSTSEQEQHGRAAGGERQNVVHRKMLERGFGPGMMLPFAEKETPGNEPPVGSNPTVGSGLATSSSALFHQPSNAQQSHNINPNINSSASMKNNGNKWSASGGGGGASSKNKGNKHSNKNKSNPQNSGGTVEESIGLLLEGDIKRLLQARAQERRSEGSLFDFDNDAASSSRGAHSRSPAGDYPFAPRQRRRAGPSAGSASNSSVVAVGGPGPLRPSREGDISFHSGRHVGTSAPAFSQLEGSPHVEPMIPRGTISGATRATHEDQSISVLGESPVISQQIKKQLQNCSKSSSSMKHQRDADTDSGQHELVDGIDGRWPQSEGSATKVADACGSVYPPVQKRMLAQILAKAMAPKLVQQRPPQIPDHERNMQRPPVSRSSNPALPSRRGDTASDVLICRMDEQGQMKVMEPPVAGKVMSLDDLRRRNDAKSLWDDISQAILRHKRGGTSSQGSMPRIQSSESASVAEMLRMTTRTPMGSDSNIRVSDGLSRTSSLLGSTTTSVAERRSTPGSRNKRKPPHVVVYRKDGRDIIVCLPRDQGKDGVGGDKKNKRLGAGGPLSTSAVSSQRGVVQVLQRPHAASKGSCANNFHQTSCSATTPAGATSSSVFTGTNTNNKSSDGLIPPSQSCRSNNNNGNKVGGAGQSKRGGGGNRGKKGRGSNKGSCNAEDARKKRGSNPHEVPPPPPPVLPSNYSPASNHAAAASYYPPPPYHEDPNIAAAGGPNYVYMPMMPGQMMVPMYPQGGGYPSFAPAPAGYYPVAPHQAAALQAPPGVVFSGNPGQPVQVHISTPLSSYQVPRSTGTPDALMLKTATSSATDQQGGLIGDQRRANEQGAEAGSVVSHLTISGASNYTPQLTNPLDELLPPPEHGCNVKNTNLNGGEQSQCDLEEKDSVMVNI
ncbi:unnamed protein product [Amoebophrya sp. A25]|nr:unnamed protein product [Amoebophrya sp. A25]|eukprot:GSA25T00019152001.1